MLLLERLFYFNAVGKDQKQKKKKKSNFTPIHGRVRTRSHPHSPCKPAQAFLKNLPPPHSSLTLPPHFSPKVSHTVCHLGPPNKFTLKATLNLKIQINNVNVYVALLRPRLQENIN
jgi:hypothetical protein